MKNDVEYLEYMWPMRHFLVSCGDIKKESNIITLSFCMPVSKNPPQIAIAIGKKAYSRELIEANQEFIINIPAAELKKEIYYCGYHSGRDVDKFKETALKPKSARRLNPPIIDECIAHMECKVTKVIETGDKLLFIGEVVEAYADKILLNESDKLKYAWGDFPKKIYSIRQIKE